MTSGNGAGYLFPCSASYKCFDRFSILDDPEVLEDPDGQVPFWPILASLLRSTPVETPIQPTELLYTIAVTLHEGSRPAGDYGLLKSFIGTSEPAFFGTY
ncbi:hypothetical protein RRF57_002220 [Xylaria bambusicola]|uniref:Uncharacterized protein n=1 Tax=Xylaria bambusicola TaxID=326684 RepID=A0AAN7U610_9PEZI